MSRMLPLWDRVSRTSRLGVVPLPLAAMFQQLGTAPRRKLAGNDVSTCAGERKGAATYFLFEKVILVTPKFSNQFCHT